MLLHRKWCHDFGAILTFTWLVCLHAWLIVKGCDYTIIKKTPTWGSNFPPTNTRLNDMFLALFIIHRHMLAIIFGFYSSVVYQRCITKTLPLFTRHLLSMSHEYFFGTGFKKYQKHENERVLEVWLFNLKYMTKISQIIWLL